MVRAFRWASPDVLMEFYCLREFIKTHWIRLFREDNTRWLFHVNNSPMVQVDVGNSQLLAFDATEVLSLTVVFDYLLRCMAENTCHLVAMVCDLQLRWSDYLGSIDQPAPAGWIRPPDLRLPSVPPSLRVLERLASPRRWRPRPGLIR